MSVLWLVKPVVARCFLVRPRTVDERSEELAEYVVARKEAAVENRVEAAVSRILSEISSRDASSLEGVIRAVAHVRGRPIVVLSSASLPWGVCGRWLAREADDVLEVLEAVPSKTFTTMHELGHMMLDHRGRPVSTTAEELSDVAASSLVEFMLSRGGADLSDDEAKQETEAEEFAGVLMRRLRQAALSHVPAVQARLDETLS